MLCRSQSVAKGDKLSLGFTVKMVLSQNNALAILCLGPGSARGNAYALGVNTVGRLWSWSKCFVVE